jgi:RNA polymerase sigma-70 factor, ECF subfamily
MQREQDLPAFGRRVRKARPRVSASEPPPATDAELVLLAGAGDARAKEALFRRHAPMVNGLAFRMLGKDEELDEVVQDAFVEALSSLDSLRDPAAFRSWLGTIVVHRVRLRIRRRRISSTFSAAKAEPVDLERVAGSASPDVTLELREVYDRIGELDREERLALLLHRVEGYTLPEVAHHMGLSLATVKRRLTSADEKLAAARSKKGAA